MIRVWTDGSNTFGGKATYSAWIIKANDGTILDKGVTEGPSGWSDIAEYNAVINALTCLISLNLQDETIEIRNDNQFVMMQMGLKWKLRASKSYYPLAIKARGLLKSFRNISFFWIPREENTEADELSKPYERTV